MSPASGPAGGGQAVSFSLFPKLAGGVGSDGEPRGAASAECWFGTFGPVRGRDDGAGGIECVTVAHVPGAVETHAAARPDARAGGTLAAPRRLAVWVEISENFEKRKFPTEIRTRFRVSVRPRRAVRDDAAVRLGRLARGTSRARGSVRLRRRRVPRRRRGPVAIEKSPQSRRLGRDGENSTLFESRRLLRPVARGGWGGRRVETVRPGSRRPRAGARIREPVAAAQGWRRRALDRRVQPPRRRAAAIGLVVVVSSSSSSIDSVSSAVTAHVVSSAIAALESPSMPSGAASLTPSCADVTVPESAVAAAYLTRATVASAEPSFTFSSGGLAGGAPVRVSGSGFRDTGLAACAFGTVAPVAATVSSSGEMTCAPPLLTPGRSHVVGVSFNRRDFFRGDPNPGGNNDVAALVVAAPPVALAAVIPSAVSEPIAAGASVDVVGAGFVLTDSSSFVSPCGGEAEADGGGGEADGSATEGDNREGSRGRAMRSRRAHRRGRVRRLAGFVAVAGRRGGRRAPARRSRDSLAVLVYAAPVADSVAPTSPPPRVDPSRSSPVAPATRRRLWVLPGSDADARRRLWRRRRADARRLVRRGAVRDAPLSRRAGDRQPEREVSSSPARRIRARARRPSSARAPPPRRTRSAPRWLFGRLTRAARQSPAGPSRRSGANTSASPGRSARFGARREPSGPSPVVARFR